MNTQSNNHPAQQVQTSTEKKALPAKRLPETKNASALQNKLQAPFSNDDLITNNKFLKHYSHLLFTVS